MDEIRRGEGSVKALEVAMKAVKLEKWQLQEEIMRGMYEEPRELKREREKEGLIRRSEEIVDEAMRVKRENEKTAAKGGEFEETLSKLEDEESVKLWLRGSRGKFGERVPQIGTNSLGPRQGGVQNMGDTKEYYVNIKEFEMLFEEFGGFDGLYMKMLTSGIPTAVQLMWIPLSELNFHQQFLLTSSLLHQCLMGLWRTPVISYARGKDAIGNGMAGGNQSNCWLNMVLEMAIMVFYIRTIVTLPMHIFSSQIYPQRCWSLHACKQGHQRHTSSCDIATCCYWSGMAFLAMVAPALPCIFGITALFARLGLMVGGGLILASFMTYSSEHLAIVSFIRGFEEQDLSR
ncbi:hypothetical protein NL676_020493 [Syzygium grande]|nr:hypothetical protein NL676_020493 [Syzygium grande]